MSQVAMAASRFNPKSFCTGGANINTASLAVTTGVVAVVVLTITTLFLVLDARRMSANRERVDRLERAF